MQFEFPWVLGPADGRYLLREGDHAQPSRVLVLATLGAPRRSLLRSRRARRAPPQPDPAPVATGRATVIATEPLGDEAAARAWLRNVDGELEVGAALAALNRALYAHRIATADPYMHGLGVDRALVIRLGYGDGEHVADGRWRDARELPPPGARRRQRRVAALRPQERLAALLGAREQPLACEQLTLGVREDLDAGRLREAAIGLQGALAAALAELAPERGRADLARRLDELAERRAAIAAIAARALGDRPTADDAETLAHVLGRIEAALRARTAAGIGEPPAAAHPPPGD